MGHVVQASLHGLKLQMYSLEEAVEKLPPKVNFALLAEILGSWIQQKIR
jgi:hypothetical protein